MQRTIARRWWLDRLHAEMWHYANGYWLPPRRIGSLLRHWIHVNSTLFCILHVHLSVSSPWSSCDVIVVKPGLLKDAPLI